MKSLYWVLSRLSFVLLLTSGSGGCAADRVPKEMLYVGTFSGRGSQGLYVFEFDREAGELTLVQTVSERESPNFQAIHPEGSYLYSVSDKAFSADTDDPAVTAYRIDRQTGMLTPINERSAQGRGPAHVSVDPQGRFVFVSNYGGGSLSVFAITDHGSLSEPVDVVKHEAIPGDERGELRPRVHSAIPSADGRFLYVSDLGLDRIMIYEVDAASGTLTPANPPFVESFHGAGPRHFTIHPSGQFAYSAEERSHMVTAFRVEPTSGALAPVQRVNMVPAGFEGSNSAADIHVSPDGRFLYASNRGHDSLVIYEIDPTTGELSLVGHEPTRGGHPRNFAVDREGVFVFVVNRDDDNLVVFRRNQSTGELTFTGIEVHVPMAVCVTQHFLM